MHKLTHDEVQTLADRLFSRGDIRQFALASTFTWARRSGHRWT